VPPPATRDGTPGRETESSRNLSKHATDDRGQEHHRGAQEQSGNNLFSQSNARVEQPAREVGGADRTWRTAISATGAPMTETNRLFAAVSQKLRQRPAWIGNSVPFPSPGACSPEW
jgi:hypothetical protein